MTNMNRSLCSCLRAQIAPWQQFETGKERPPQDANRQVCKRSSVGNSYINITQSSDCTPWVNSLLYIVFLELDPYSGNCSTNNTRVLVMNDELCYYFNSSVQLTGRERNKYIWQCLLNGATMNHTTNNADRLSVRLIYTHFSTSDQEL